MTSSTMSRDIPLDLIDADPDQPRRHFDEHSLEELARSLREHGQAVPIMVRPVADRFVIVHGERRCRAARLAEMTTVRAEVRDLTAEGAGWLALSENVQREGLTPIEEALAYQRLLGRDMTQEALGAKIGKSQSYIAQKLRLLSLPEHVQLYLDRRLLTEGHARQLLRLRGIYQADDGADLLRDLTPAVFDDAMLDPDYFRHDFDREENPEAKVTGGPGYFYLLNALRVEDQPLWWPATKDEATITLYCDACAALMRRGQAIDWQLPQWELAALWWSALVADFKLPVADLAKSIDKWHERFCSAVCRAWLDPTLDGYVDNRRLDATIHTTEAADAITRMATLEWYGWRSDLRHSGLNPNDRHALVGRLARAHQTCADFFVFASSVQPGRPGYDQWVKLAAVAGAEGEVAQ